MLRTYKAVLHSDHVEWLEEPPVQARPIEVQIVFLEESMPHHEPNQGRAMAQALTRLAQLGGVTAIPDPVSWQREIRADRALPDRES